MSAWEAERLKALRAYQVLDTEAEARFDRITALAADLFDAPICLVSLLDAERQWFKSHHGVSASETPRAWAFCEHAIQGGPGSVMVVPDAEADPRFASNPLVLGQPNIRFYAGAVLTSPSGHGLGTLCVLDSRPRQNLGPAEMRRLSMLAGLVMDELDLSRVVRESQERQHLLEMAEAMSGVGHWRVEPNGGVQWSDEVYRIHGVDRACFDPNVDGAVAFYHPDDQAAVAAYVARGLSHREDFEFQLRLTRTDGELRYVTCKAVCERAQTGGTAAIVGVFQDVTQQVRDLETIRQGEARHRLIVESASDIVSRMGPDGRVKYFSPSVTAVTGYSVAEVTGASMIPLLHPDDLEATLATYRRLFAGESLDGPLSYRVRHKEGRWIWLEGSPTLVRDAEGAPLELIDVRRDITAKVKLEAKLRAAKDAAIEAAEIKSAFMANMSHEIRTPLTAIIGFTSLLTARPGLDDTARTHVARVASASRALLSIVNDILDFSKLEAGQVEIKVRPVAPGELLSDALDLFAPQAEAKGLTLEFVTETALPPGLWIDPDRVRQILLNLIGNAVKFTETGGIVLAAAYDASSSRLELRVEDTGPGLSRAQQAKLFKRFSQVDASTTRRHGGTGLGLAICRGLVDAMGGDISVRSRLGRGSVFHIVIDALLAPTPSAASDGSTAVSLGGLRVLVADDNQTNHDLVNALLAGQDIDLTQVLDGIAAVEAAEAAPFDIILMDVRMPGMDGPAAVRRIRSGGGPNADIPILAFSADLDLSGFGDAATLFDGFVRKPITAAGLIAALAQATEPLEPIGALRTVA